MKKSLLLIFTVLGLSSCASLQNAGNASYSVKPVIDAAGVAHCCQVDIKDGKERAALQVHVTKDGDKYQVDLVEQGVVAFEGQRIAAGAAQGIVDQAAKAAVAAALAPILPSLAPAVGALISSGATGAVVGGAAIGITADKLLASPVPAVQPGKK